MDVKEAKFILQSFRPNGVDSELTEFQEALQLTLKDQELGDWFAQERAADMEFVNALTSVEVPDTLREDILVSVANQVGDQRPLFNQEDHEFANAFSGIEPPASLRNEILSAMKQGSASTKQKKEVSEPAKNVISFKKWVMPFAAAALVAFAYILMSQPKSYVQQAPLAVTQVQDGFIDIFEAPLFRLDKKSEDTTSLINWVSAKELPVCNQLPVSMRELEGMGCKELNIGGKLGSLICLKLQDSSLMHIVVFNKDDVEGELPSLENVELVSQNNWNVAQWDCQKNTHIVLTKLPMEQLQSYF